MTAIARREREHQGTILADDGYHLTTKGGELIAESIIAAIETDNSKPQSLDNTTQEKANLTIPDDIAKHVIGKGGKRIKEISDKYQITIGKDHDRSNNLILTLIGKYNQIQQATDDINNIISTQLENQKTATQHKNEHPGETCKFFIRHGKCKYGENCWYDHPTNNETREPTARTSTKPQPTHRSRSPHRKYNRTQHRSRSRHTSNQSRPRNRHNSHNREETHTPREYHVTPSNDRRERRREPEWQPAYRY